MKIRESIKMTDLNDDIARYLSGRMPPAEMHALEKKALDDPFLADALAGAESISVDEFSADVSDLQDQVNRRIAQRSTGAVLHGSNPPRGKQVSLWTWPTRVAAGLLLIVSAGVVIFFIADKKTDHLAMREVSSEQNDHPQSAASDSIQESSSTNSHLDTETKREQPDAESDTEEAQPQAATPSEDRKVPLTSPSASKQQAQALSSKDDAGDHQQAQELKPSSGDIAGNEQPTHKTKPSEIAADEQSKAIAGKTSGVKSFATEAPSGQPSEELSRKASDAELPPATRAEQRNADEIASAEAGEKSKSIANESEKKRDVASNDAATRAALKKTSPAPIAEPGKELATNNTEKTIFTGKVVDTDGSGIPGVNVVIKGTNTGTVTDINGNYQLVDDNAHPTLVYTFIGYSNVEVVADTSTPATVTLSEDLTQLSEVVVAGYGVSRSTDPTESMYDFAYPYGGRRAYKQYLEKNLQYPQDALLNNVEGRVTVTFAVETTGLLSDFKVIKGIGNGCDEEVIRLIKAGPKWTPTKRDDVAEKSTIKVRMRFQLPREKKKK